MSLDAHTLDLEELRNGLSNVTCLRIFDPSDSTTGSSLADWKASKSTKAKIPGQAHEITVSILISYAYKSICTSYKLRHFSISIKLKN